MRYDAYEGGEQGRTPRAACGAGAAARARLHHLLSVSATAEAVLEQALGAVVRRLPPNKQTLRGNGGP
jgi:hypothetical protein